MTQMEVSRVPLQRSRGVGVEDTTDSSSADDVSISQIDDVHSSIFHTATTLPAGMSTPFATGGGQVKEEPSKVGTSKFVSILHQNPVHVKNSPLAPSKLPALDEINVKRYRLFWAPNTREDLESYCFRIIGQGDTFCINQNCQTAHRKTMEESKQHSQDQRPSICWSQDQR